MKKNIFVAILLITLAVSAFGIMMLQKKEEEKESDVVQVVTSFYPMYIAALNVINESPAIELENLSEPQTGCLHDFQLTPEDMKLLSEADVFIINGGGMESFLEDVYTQYPDLVVIDTSKDIEMIDDNAHFWMEFSKYQTQIDAIAQGLGEAAPSSAETLQQNAVDYKDKIEALREETEMVNELTQGSSVVIFHEAFEYLAQDYGIRIAETLDLDEERQVSANEVADLLTTIQSENIGKVFAEELYGSEMGQTVMRETTAKVYYLNTLSRGEYEKDSYINGMKENIQIITKAYEVR
ncbi:MAG: metal ABC transporter substrate-binding protein [Lachnospiraceae bacterium]